MRLYEQAEGVVTLTTTVCFTTLTDTIL